MTESSKRKATAARRSGARRKPVHAVDEDDVREAAVMGSASKFTEVKATDRLASAVSGRFCYCPALGWQEWTGQQWKDVSEDVVTEVARKRHRSWYGQALIEAMVEKGGGAKINAIKRLLSKAGVSACVSLCRGVLHVDVEAFDADPDLLNTPSGVVDLRTGKLSAHDPGRYMRQMTAIGYKPGAKHRDWTAVLRAIRADTRDYMQVRAGQAITGYQPEDDVLDFLQGGGENGKSTYVGGITKPLGSYYRQVSDKVLLADAKAHSTELTDLFGVRVATIEELPEGRHLSAVLLKKVTSPEITARRIRQDTMTWQATHTTVVTTNYETTVAETDWGTWRRLERVVFPYTFVKRSGDKKRRDQRVGDPNLRDRVRNDPDVQAAALAWMVAGAVRWYENGRRMPPRPQSVERDTLEWRLKSDLVLRYWSEFLEADPDAWVVRSAFAKHFNKWLVAEGHQRWSAQRIAERWKPHDVFKAANVEETSIRPRRGQSIPPDLEDDESGNGEHVKPTGVQRVWVGFRYRGGGVTEVTDEVQ